MEIAYNSTIDGNILKRSSLYGFVREFIECSVLRKVYILQKG